MATILAANTGNWSATGTWTGGVVPVAGDIVVANGKTITMDTLTITVAELRNDTTGGAVAGGTFNLVNGSNITANVYAGSSATSCVTWAGTTGQAATVTGSMFGGTSSGHALNCTGGNLTLGGGSNTTGGTGSGASAGINFSSAGTFIFATAGNPGAITGGTSSNSGARGIDFPAANSNITVYATTIAANTSGSGLGINLSSTSQTVNIVASNIGTTTASTTAINVTGASANHTYTLSGNVVAGSGSGSYGIVIQNTGTYGITVSGNISGGNGGTAVGILNTNAATVNITGNFINNATAVNSGNFSVANNSTGTINITGTVTAGNIQGTANNASTGILRCTRAKGNGYGAGSAGINNVQAVLSAAQGSLTYIEELEFGSLGNTPVSGPIRLTAATTNKAIFTTTTGTTKTLVDTAATSGVLPSAADVRTGTVYSSGNLTGTCAVPAAGSVALGVPVDATTGTAVLTAANARTALGMASANLDAQLAAIPTTAAPTVTAIRTELDTNSTKLANLDATVSSRSTYAGGDTSGTTTLLSRLTSTRAGYLDNIATAAPSAVDIATAVWGAATRTLTTAIDNSATIAAAVWSYATGRTITGGTVDTLTNAPSVPSAAAIASQVRTELTTELARIDATVSSRLAPAGTLARVTLTDTATTLTNAPTVPSAAAIAAAVWAAADKTGYSLTSAERQAIATAVEQSILNESDGQQVLNAIVGAIGNTNVDQVALVAAIRADLERSGGTLATRLAASSYTTPPTAAANATAVRSELASELARVANCATVATTGQQIQDAVTN